ncbi:MAG: segregation/condensation protein A [Clostridia bacterium]|nr:segregation/condensation protein A [Clostridia bacterium]
MEAISYKLPDFEGPLDLLLFLVQKNKLNIYDIPISQVLEQYLAAIEQMKEYNMDVASEFLEMAARLVHIKSVMLLPRYEEETEELKRELTGQLIEYQLCQQMARRLAMDYVGGDLFVRQPQEIEPDLTYRRTHRPEEMLDAFLAAAGRGRRRLPPPVQAFRGIVSRKIVSVSSRIAYVLRRLYSRKKVSYTSFFEKAESKSEMVATFLALLELIKTKRIRVDGEGRDQHIAMRPRDQWDQTVQQDLQEEGSLGMETAAKPDGEEEKHGD